MGLDDVVSTESAFVAAATAAVFSPRTRETLRRGAVLGVAGALRAGDVLVGAARGVSRGVRREETVATPETKSSAKTAARSSRPRRSPASRTAKASGSSASSS